MALKMLDPRNCTQKTSYDLDDNFLALKLMPVERERRDGEEISVFFMWKKGKLMWPESGSWQILVPRTAATMRLVPSALPVRCHFSVNRISVLSP